MADGDSPDIVELPAENSLERPAKKAKRLASHMNGMPLEDTPSTSAVTKPHMTISQETNDFGGLFLTTAKGIGAQFNRPKWTRDMKSILSPEMGNLQTSVQFNYMFDIPWIVEQYSEEFRTKPLLIVHGEQNNSAGGQELRQDASLYPNITLARAPLPMPFGTHHTKMMLLSYDTGMRVVIHTSNLISGDWHMKTQGMWISPVFPKTDSPSAPDSETNFKADLVEYLKTYNIPALTKLSDSLRNYDMSSARVCLVASTPGRHTGAMKTRFGHLKLRNLLSRHCVLPDGTAQQPYHDWPVIGQFSSVGSLGTTPDSWLTGELLQTFSTPTTGPLARRAVLNLIYPSIDDVRMSLEGWRGGGSLPYSEATAKKQPYFNKFLHVWRSVGKGRNHCMPHIKTYTRVSPDLNQCSWLLITSANMSKAAWGALEKANSQLMMRSYEIGILLLPKFHHPTATTFSITSDLDSSVADVSRPAIFLPYDLPLEEYKSTDQPWTCDGAMTGLKDRFGRSRR